MARQITQDEIENPELDNEVQSIIDSQCDDYVPNIEEIKDVIAGNGTENIATNTVRADYDGKFLNEVTACNRVAQKYQAKIPEQQKKVNELTAEKKQLEKNNNHQQKGAEIFTGTKNTATGILIAKSGSWVLYILGFVSTVYFLVTIAEMEWLKAIFLPLAGVSVVYWGGKYLLWSLSHSKVKFYPAVKYAIGLIGICSAVAWLYYYSKLAGSMTGPIDIGSLNDSSASPSGNHESNIMIFLGALGESLVGAFLYAVGNDIKEKHTSFDGEKDTPEYAKIKENLKNAEDDLNLSKGRVIHANNLVNIIQGKRHDIESQAAVAFNKLFQEKLNS